MGKLEAINGVDAVLIYGLLRNSSFDLDLIEQFMMIDILLYECDPVLDLYGTSLLELLLK